MAVTFTISATKRLPMGNLWKIIGTIVASGTYTTGGDALTAANVGLGRLDIMRVSNVGGKGMEYDYTNSKLKQTHTGVLMTHNAAPAAQPVSVTAADTGLEATLGVTATLDVGPATEVTSGTSVSWTSRFEAVGV